MIVRNPAKTTKTIVSNGNAFPGTVEGQTYTATEDNQLLRLWGQHRPSTADGRIHMFGCHRGCAGACGADERRCHVQRRSGNHGEQKPVDQRIAHGLRCEGPARMPRNLLGRRLDCPSDGRRQLLRQGYGNLLALISLGVAA